MALVLRALILTLARSTFALAEGVRTKTLQAAAVPLPTAVSHPPAVSLLARTTYAVRLLEQIQTAASQVTQMR